MTGFEPWTSGIGSNRSTNWATTTASSVCSDHSVHCATSTSLCKSCMFPQQDFRSLMALIISWIGNYRQLRQCQLLNLLNQLSCRHMIAPHIWWHELASFQQKWINSNWKLEQMILYFNCLPRQGFTSATRLGNFWKILAIIFLPNVAQISRTFRGQILKMLF